MKHRLKTSLALSLLATSVFSLSSYALPNLDGLSNEEKIQVIDNTISDTMLKITDMEDKINENEKSLEEKSKLLIETQKQYESKKELVNNTSNLNIINSKNGEFKILEMLLNSESISEFLKNLEISKLMIKESNKSLKVLDEQESQLIELRSEILDEQAKLDNDKLNLEKENESLDELKKQVEEEIKKEEERLRQLALQQAQQQQSQQQDNQNTNYVIPDVNVPASERATALINYAKQFVGVPYVWGGSSPSGFDCSGLTSYVFRNAVGVGLPRTASSQQTVGTKVALSQLQAGDLIFFGYPAYHVGLYIGNGQYLHAPKPGDRVKIANVPWNRLSSASRVL